MSAVPKPLMDVTEEQAKVLIGKRILVGVAYCNADGSVLKKEQFHGTALRANPAEGLVICLAGTNEEKAFEMMLDKLEIARPGKYTLRNTGEIVTDPDYTLEVDIAI
ncbi:MAG: hypothetical protein AB7H77_03645 [Bdellovibrionales bacterium]